MAVIPAKAGIQLPHNTWIPGQARNDVKSFSPKNHVNPR